MADMLNSIFTAIPASFGQFEAVKLEKTAKKSSSVLPNKVIAYQIWYEVMSERMTTFYCQLFDM